MRGSEIDMTSEIGGAASEAALASAAVHLLGQSRAFLFQVEAALLEIGSLHDGRADRVVEALERTASDPGGPGTLRDLEQVVSVLVRSLVAEEAS